MTTAVCRRCGKQLWSRKGKATDHHCYRNKSRWHKLTIWLTGKRGLEVEQ